MYPAGWVVECDYNFIVYRKKNAAKCVHEYVNN